MILNTNTRVRFDDIAHSYLLDEDIFLMGVTSLMKKHGLSPDYSGISEEVLNKAAERGSKVHKDIEDYCNGKPIVMTPEVKAYAKLNIQPIANEYLISDNKIVASSIDIVADAGVNGMVNLIDIKTTSTLHTDSLSWQLSIYAYLFALQNPDITINKLYGLHIRNGKAKMVEVARIPAAEVARLLECEEEDLPYFYNTPELSIPQINALAELQGIADNIALIKLSLKEAEDKKKEIEKYILEQMEASGRKTLENGPIKVTYVAESERESVDKTRLQNDLPELYEKYKKVTIVAPSVRVTIKK